MSIYPVVAQGCGALSLCTLYAVRLLYTVVQNKVQSALVIMIII